MSRKKYDAIIKHLPLDKGLTVSDLNHITKQLNSEIEFLIIDTSLSDAIVPNQQNSCVTMFIPVQLADYFNYKVDEIINFISTKYDFLETNLEFYIIDETGQKYSILVE